MCEMLEKPGKMKSGHAEWEGASTSNHFSHSGVSPLGAPQSTPHSKLGREMEAARAPEIVSVVSTEIRNSSCPSGGPS